MLASLATLTTLTSYVAYAGRFCISFAVPGRYGKT
jgi:hypothetical protein